MNEKLIDLHIHSIYSDGELSPNEILKLASKKNINTISITDHDTILGLKNITYNNDVKVIPGIELSAHIEKGQLHILGYEIDINNDNLNKFLNQMKQQNLNYIKNLLLLMKKYYNIDFKDEDENKLLTSTSNIGRPHVARILIEYGLATAVSEAFDKYFLPINSEIKKYNMRPSYETCINIIKEAGGIPVLAHPKLTKLSDEDLELLIQKMINCGLEGIEVYHSKHLEEDVIKYEKLIEKYNLLCSGGSDFHGKTVKPDVELGTGKNNNLKIKKLSIIDRIDINKTN